MKAIVVSTDSPHGIRFSEVDEIAPTCEQMVIEVSHVSLNCGDINDARSGRIPENGTLGSDAVGFVKQQALCGKGPRVGERVVTMTSGAFAQYCHADISKTVTLPPSVASSKAVTLPVAGLAALQGLNQAGVAVGSRVLVTGASGSVGRAAIQLAGFKGARVSGIAGLVHHADLKALGVIEVVSDIEKLEGEFEIILDTVGGYQLRQAWGKLKSGGRLVCIGSASGLPTTFEPYALIGTHKTIMSFLIDGDIAGDLSELVSMLAHHNLRVDIGWEGSWTGIDLVIDNLRNRKIRGKCVLQVHSE